MIEVFVYGSLLDAPVLERQSGRPGLARRMRPARLRGWRRLVFPGWRYPTLCRDPDAKVDGALITLEAGVLRRLEAYEGAHYRMVRLVVAEGRRRRPAYAFIAAAAAGTAAARAATEAVRP